MRKLLCMVLLAAVLAGCSRQDRDTQYTLACGVTLTAAEGLTQTPQDSFAGCLSGGDVVILFSRDDKARSATLEDFARAVARLGGSELQFSTDKWGSLAASYTGRSGGRDCWYYLSVHESDGSYWLCQMVCDARDRQRYRESFGRWSASLTLADLPQSQAYRLQCGMEITLLPGLTEAADTAFDGALYGAQMGMTLLREEKPEGWTLEDYAAVLSADRALPLLQPDGCGTLATAYLAEAGGVCWYYYLTVHETADAFWVCQICCPEQQAREVRQWMPWWSASLTQTE